MDFSNRPNCRHLSWGTCYFCYPGCLSTSPR